MERQIRAALYARVSSDRQEREETIQSQLSELRARVQLDGVVDCLELIDESYGRDNLVRPRLDRLRDLVVQGELDRLYIQCPDRLASGAKLMLLVEEFQQAGVELIFLKGAVDDTPEGKLLLHMQGAIAEYERTKIAERTRRGKLYWAKQGAIVGGHAPYGYRFIRRTDTQRARFELAEYQASVVQGMYRWLVAEQMSTRGIAGRLTELGILTARGAKQWQPTAVDRILRNPVYYGSFMYCRTERAMPLHRLSNDPYRQNRKTGRRARPEEEWIIIPVPAVVDKATWLQAQEQLKQNAIHSSRNNKKNRYLLRSLIRCPRCGSTYTGAVQHGYRRYRCTRTDPAVSSTGKKCPPGSISADLVEQAVWEAIKEALQRPEALVEEYQRQLAQAGMPDALEGERKQVALALKRVKAQADRVTDAYINEVMDLDRYKAEMEKLKGRSQELERSATEIERRVHQEADSRAALRHLGQFCDRVSEGLESLSFDGRQQLLRLVVQRITLEGDRVCIQTVIPNEGDSVQLRAHHPEALEGRTEYLYSS